MQFLSTQFSPCPCSVYLLMRWALKSHLGDGLQAACSGSDGGASERTHLRLPHHDVDEPGGHHHGSGGHRSVAATAAAVSGSSGVIKDRGLHEMVPLVSRY